MKKLAPYLAAILAWSSLFSPALYALNKAMPAMAITLGQIGTAGTTTFATSAANQRQGIQFTVNEAKQVSKVKQYVSAVTGTISATGYVVDIFSNNDATQVPNASLESRTSVTTTPTGAGWVESTGFTSASTLVAGGKYWIITKNTTGTPASNFFTLRTVNGFQLEVLNGLTAGSWVARKTSTDGGATWSAFGGSAASFRIEFSDGTFWGQPLEAVTAAAPVGVGVYSTREHGVKFTVPTGTGCYNLAGAMSQFSTTGSPTGLPRYRLYNGTTLLATSISMNPTLTGGNVGYFTAASLPQICGGGTYRIAMGETAQADASTNRLNLAQVIDIENDANSKALMPWGVMQTYFDGSSWADTDTKYTSWTLLVSTVGESQGLVFVPVE